MLKPSHTLQGSPKVHFYEKLTISSCNITCCFPNFSSPSSKLLSLFSFFFLIPSLFSILENKLGIGIKTFPKENRFPLSPTKKKKNKNVSNLHHDDPPAEVPPSPPQKKKKKKKKVFKSQTWRPRGLVLLSSRSLASGPLLSCLSLKGQLTALFESHLEPAVASHLLSPCPPANGLLQPDAEILFLDRFCQESSEGPVLRACKRREAVEIVCGTVPFVSGGGWQ